MPTSIIGAVVHVFFVSAAVLSAGRLCSGSQGAPDRPPPALPPPPNVKRFVFFIVALKLYRFCFIYALYIFPYKINAWKPMFCLQQLNSLPLSGILVIIFFYILSCIVFSREVKQMINNKMSKI